MMQPESTARSPTAATIGARRRARMARRTDMRIRMGQLPRTARLCRPGIGGSAAAAPKSAIALPLLIGGRAMKRARSVANLFRWIKELSWGCPPAWGLTTRQQLTPRKERPDDQDDPQSGAGIRDDGGDGRDDGGPGAGRRMGP